eukprot:7382638-Prymnesium_polylepis.1
MRGLIGVDTEPAAASANEGGRACSLFGHAHGRTKLRSRRGHLAVKLGGEEKEREDRADHGDERAAEGALLQLVPRLV